MMKRKALEIWVGLFVIVGLLALVFLAFKVGNLGSADIGDSYKVKAIFDNIGQLKPKAPVRLGGVLIGRVGNISINGDYKAEVEIKFGKNFRIPVDSKLSIRTSGLLGEQYVAVHPGVIDEFLTTGNKISEGNTQSAIVLEDLISRFFFNKASEVTKE